MVCLLSVALRIVFGVGAWPGTRGSPTRRSCSPPTPERQSLFESHRQRRWLTRWSYAERYSRFIDNNGYVLAPLPVAPVNEADTVLLPEGLKALKRVAKRTDLVLEGAYLNLDGGFDSKANRKAIFNAGLIPNIQENPRNRKTTKRGRKRWFNAVIHALRERVERTFAWEDKFKRLLLRFEYIQQRHYGMKLLAYTLINVRRFCSA